MQAKQKRNTRTSHKGKLPIGDVVERIIFSDMYRHFFKRAIDIVLSLMGLIVFAIPMLIIAIAVKLDSKGPVFFRQERIGLGGKTFTMMKFRSMCVGAEHTGSGVYSGKNDSRVTRVGNILRKTSLDEIPQFINTLRGERGIIETTKKNADFSRVVTVNSISL